MDQKAPDYVESDIVMVTAITSSTRISRILTLPSGEDTGVVLTEREWRVLALIVNEFRRPLADIVGLVEEKRRGSFEQALSAYLEAYEDEWRKTAPRKYDLFFPA